MIVRLTTSLMIAGAIALAQQVLILNSGAQIQGRYDGGNANSISFIDAHGDKHKFDIAEVQSLIVDGPAPTAYMGSVPTVPVSYPEPGYPDADLEPQRGWSRSAMIPVGAQLVVRTIDRIEVRKPDPHQHFLASVGRDVIDTNGVVIIPRGSMAHLIAHEVGGGDIAIDLRSVNVSGRRYIINAEDITNTRVRDGLGANKRTAKFVGGAALLGTVLGAIAGGGRGAAIGALAGGAAGAGTQVLTRGHELHIPSETILTFRLDRPVYLYQ